MVWFIDTSKSKHQISVQKWYCLRAEWCHAETYTLKLLSQRTKYEMWMSRKIDNSNFPTFCLLWREKRRHQTPAQPSTLGGELEDKSFRGKKVWAISRVVMDRWCNVMDRWCNWLLMVWAFIVILLLSTFFTSIYLK